MKTTVLSERVSERVDAFIHTPKRSCQTRRASFVSAARETLGTFANFILESSKIREELLNSLRKEIRVKYSHKRAVWSTRI